MDCSNCNHTNRQGAKFCEECGNKLVMACPQCNNALSNPAAKFCGECGFKLQQAPATTKPRLIDSAHNPIIDTPKRQAERRQLTVMFCDLVGSTALSDNMDVEEFRQVILDYQVIVEGVVSEYGGNVGNYLGDGLLVYFGYPIGLEDAPKVSVRCGLGILNAIEKANKIREQAGKALIVVRMGIHVGVVVVDDHLALGDTTNIAARLEGLAEHNTIIISPQLLKLVEGWFDTESKGTHKLKGIAEEVEVFQVIKERNIRSKFEIKNESGLMPLVGRDRQIHSLRSLWSRVAKGQGRSAFIHGEAGIGKSRLIEELKRDKDNVINLYCSNYHKNAPFFPLRDFLQRKELKFHKNKTINAKKKQIKSFLSNNNLNDDNDYDTLCALVGLENEETIAPTELKELTFVLLEKFFISRGEKDPLLIVVDDLQWIDPSTLEWLTRIMSLINNQSLMIVAASRDALPVEWNNLSIGAETLDPLGPTSIEEMCRNLSQGMPLPLEVLTQIINRADGVPLFVEELTLMILESESLNIVDGKFVLLDSKNKISIPSSLQDSLMARLDNMNDFKSTIQLGAVLGREFQLDIFQSITGEDSDTLAGLFDALVDLGFLIKKEKLTDVTYVFKSAMIQEIAYTSMLKSQRCNLHLKVAEALSDQKYQDHGSHTILLATHYSEAGEIQKAVNLWEKASDNSLKINAYKEARVQLENALEIIDAIKDPKLKPSLELGLNLKYSTVLRVLNGWNNDSVQKAYDKCLELCKNAGDSQQLFLTIFGIYTSYLVDANLEKGLDVAKQLSGIAERLESDPLKMYAHLAQANILFYQGRLKEAEKHVLSSRKMYKQSEHHNYLNNFGIDPQVFDYSFSIWIPYLLGDFGKSIKWITSANKLVGDLKHPFSTTVVKTSESWYRQILGDVDETMTCSEEVLSMTEDLGFSFYRAWAFVFKGWGVFAKGDKRIGLEMTAKGKNLLFDNGCKLMTYPCAVLASLYLNNNNPVEALEVLKEGVEYINRNGEHVFEPEIYRLKGMALSDLGRDRLAKEAFDHSIKVADELSLSIFKFRTLNTLGRYHMEEIVNVPSIVDEISDHIKTNPSAKGSKEFEYANTLIA